MALKLRRAEERCIPQSTRAGSFKRLLGGPSMSHLVAEEGNGARIGIVQPGTLELVATYEVA